MGGQWSWYDSRDKWGFVEIICCDFNKFLSMQILGVASVDFLTKKSHLNLKFKETLDFLEGLP